MGLSSKDISRFGPKAQTQIMAKMARPREKKESKYHARRDTYIAADGSAREFDSVKEKARYVELLLMQKAGDICSLTCQVPYELIPAQKRDDGTTEKGVRYVADFVYTDRDGNTVVEDVKGFKGGQAYREFVIKRKLMLFAHGISVREV